MLLTLKHPGHSGFNKSFHDYSPPTPPSTSRFSPALTVPGPPFPTDRLGTIPPHVSKSMSTPHRGLPPPAAMTLPQPQPSQAPPSLVQPQVIDRPMGQLPAPPQQWQGAEESMRNWLQAKVEEDRRKQEEEKTHQESLRLEQRKIEQDMLRTSLSGGIPPYMIPLVFAGMGGGNLPNASLEWAQHYMATTHQLQQQQQQAPSAQSSHQQGAPLLPPSYPSPELRRESRQIVHAHSGSQHAINAPIPSAAGGAPIPAAYYPSSPSSRNRQSLPGPSTLARPSQQGHLPRLNTAELHPQAPAGPSSIQILPGQAGHPLSQTQTHEQSSPSIYFHHWQPPAPQSGDRGNQPTTPSDAPYSPPQRKRKAQGPQQAAPPPRTQPQFSSGLARANTTGGSSTRRRRHSRQPSELSSRGFDYYQPRSRHRDTGSSFSTTSGASPPHQRLYETSEQPIHEMKDAMDSEHHTPRQQRFSIGPDILRPSSRERERERQSPDRERREPRERLSSVMTAGIKRDHSR